jgi:hypothetical protein
MKIAIDFDGTCVKHEFPDVGEDCPGAVETLKRLVADGHELFLFTMRSDKYLTDAMRWFQRRGIWLSGIQSDPNQKAWTNSPKCYAQTYIDDAALGAPLIYPEDGGRPFYDWRKAWDLLAPVLNESDRNPVVNLDV